MEKKRNKYIIAIIVLSVILAALLAVVVWMEFGVQKQAETPAEVRQTLPTQSQETEEPVQTEATQETTVPVVVEERDDPCLIQTPYIELYFDEAFADLLGVVHTNGAPYLLEFYAILEEKPEQRLFDIAIGEGSDGNLGTIQTQQGVVPVSMTIYAFNPDESWNEGEITTVQAMQEVANDLLQQLMEHQAMDDYDGPIISDELPESTWVDYLTIQTPYIDLRYPAVWNDSLLVEEEEADEYWVKFYGQLEDRDPILLFSVILGGDYGEQVGVIPNGEDGFITVNLMMEVLQLDEIAEADAQMLYSMQEDANRIIESIEDKFIQ